MSKPKYVVGRDGHVLSESEQQEATRLDEPVSTEGAPDTRVAHLATVTIERNRRMIQSYERRITENTAELTTETDEWWRNFLNENIALSRRRITELEAEIRAAQGVAG